MSITCTKPEDNTAALAWWPQKIRPRSFELLSDENDELWSIRWNRPQQNSAACCPMTYHTAVTDRECHYVGQQLSCGHKYDTTTLRFRYEYRTSVVSCDTRAIKWQWILSVCLENVSRGLLNCGISVSLLPVPECSTDSANRSFCRSAIFGKVGRIASEETVLELIKTKCIPALMFGMEACPLKKRDINSLDFVFMKLLKTSDINIVRTCQHVFGFELPSVLLDRRTRKFLEKWNIYELRWIISK